MILNNTFVLIHGEKGSGKRNILKLLCKKNCMNYLEKDSENI